MSTVETLITVAVILLLIAAGALLIDMLNVQHAQRTAAFRYRRNRAGPPPQTRRPRPPEAGGKFRRRGHPSGSPPYGGPREAEGDER